MRTKNTNLKDVWQTPKTIINLLPKIDLDPCAGSGYSCDIQFLKDGQVVTKDNYEYYQIVEGETYQQEPTNIGATNWTDNALRNDWFGNVFVNPPFSQKSDFLEKAIKEYIHNNDVKTIYFLTPDSTDTKSWWHQYIAAYADYIWLSKGRINYVSPIGHEPNPSECCDTNAVTFGTAISMFGNPETSVLRDFSEKGQLVKTVKEADLAV